MNSFELLRGEWKIFVMLSSLFIFSYIGGQVLFVVNNDFALKIVDKLDSPREKIVKIICRYLFMPYGVIRATFIIFFVNLFGGALIWSSIGGIFIIIPFIHNIMTGSLTGLVLKKYPERMNWLTLFNVFFEIGAFICAAVGGIQIGMSILGTGNIYLSITNWSKIFLTVVVPLQFIGAVFEGFLFKRLFIDKNISLPYGLRIEDLSIKK